jgi:hypothetical protein
MRQRGVAARTASASGYQTRDSQRTPPFRPRREPHPVFRVRLSLRLSRMRLWRLSVIVEMNIRVQPRHLAHSAISAATGQLSSSRAERSLPRTRARRHAHRERRRLLLLLLRSATDVRHPTLLVHHPEPTGRYTARSGRRVIRERRLGIGRRRPVNVLQLRRSGIRYPSRRWRRARGAVLSAASSR